ncbi:DNA alkylation repair protein [Pseudoflavitalea sp. G-6-1-2]|uniref:DNA alkylation repair protein n=1 Tax=Pseudoflavitalea sp. G-6-1-2 TaxID=2728841 RepID=UPI00146E7F70|nr:DNA alkylation repair protein [Pseudoflavitalea sp. G-6-1-2]NML22924.1 DNA alkylation repair protein [Pseudoflavitalea sp. G-6-1-2]
MKTILTRLRADLKAIADPEVKATHQRFFKEEIKAYGIKLPNAKAVGKKFTKEIKALSKAEVYALCEELWKSGYFEESIIACDWSYSQRKAAEPEDFRMLETWVKTYVTNWASCDTLCNHTVGEFLIKYPQFLPELKRWAVSKNRWMRRGAAVSLIVPARKNLFFDEMLEIASLQLTDTDDMVQKGYGWMLKSAVENNLDAVYKFVMKHKAVMPRTALRYAIEKMPADKKAKAMEK